MENASTTSRESKDQYITLKIRIPIEDYKRGFPYFKSRKALNSYAVDAVQEKINRAAANDKASRMRELMTNMRLLEPLLLEMWKMGKLKFIVKDDVRK